FATRLAFSLVAPIALLIGGVFPVIPLGFCLAAFAYHWHSFFGDDDFDWALHKEAELRLPACQKLRERLAKEDFVLTVTEPELLFAIEEANRLAWVHPSDS